MFIYIFYLTHRWIYTIYHSKVQSIYSPMRIYTNVHICYMFFVLCIYVICFSVLFAILVFFVRAELQAMPEAPAVASPRRLVVSPGGFTNVQVVASIVQKYY